MHMFNRGFNGKQVGIVGGVKTGPVPLNAAAPGPVAAPVVSGGGAVAKPVAMPKPTGPVTQTFQAPAAPPVQPQAPTSPGAVPMGKKANCPVCRTFGG